MNSLRRAIYIVHSLTVFYKEVSSANWHFKIHSPYFNSNTKVVIAGSINEVIFAISPPLNTFFAEEKPLVRSEKRAVSSIVSLAFVFMTTIIALVSLYLK